MLSFGLAAMSISNAYFIIKLKEIPLGKYYWKFCLFCLMSSALVLWIGNACATQSLGFLTGETTLIHHDWYFYDTEKVISSCNS